MEKEKTRGRTRRKQPSRIAGFLYKEGRRWCAVALSVCMILSNMAGTVFAADVENEDEFLFKLTRSSLYEALQQAVLEKNVVDEEFLFQGEEDDQEAYKKLVEMNDDLYELKPEIKNRNKDLKLRVFASLDWGVELGQEYKVMGGEKFIFLFTNTSETEQQAVIQVDEKLSEIITIAPKEELRITEEETEGEGNGEEEALGAGGNGGQAGGTTKTPEETSTDETEETREQAIEEDITEESTENAKDESKAEDELAPADEENSEKVNGEEQADNNGQTEDNKPEEGSEQADNEQPEEKEESKEPVESKEQTENKEPVESKEQTENKEPVESKEPEESKGQEESKEQAENKEEGSKEQTENKESAEDKTSIEDKTEADNKSQNSDKSQIDDKKTDNDETQVKPSQNADDNKREEKDEPTEKKEQLENKENTQTKDKASEEKLSDEKTDNKEKEDAKPEKDTGKTEEKGNGEQQKEDNAASSKDSLSANISRKTINLVAASQEESLKASASEASPSDAEEKLLDGTIYNSILMNGEAVNIFVTTAKDLGLDKDEFKSLQIYETEIDDFTVRVGAEKGVLPENAELRVIELKEEEEEHAEQYQEAKEALDKEEIDYDGMMALDISFFDNDGEEIEPNGEVKVSIKLNPNRIPEEVVPESISVQHLEEKKTGEVQAVQVADVAEETEGKVEINEEEAIAEFSVESFSTFTITWKYESIWREYETEIVLHYVDEDGDEIEENVSVGNETIERGTQIYFSSYSKKVETDLKYVGATLDTLTGKKITSIKFNGSDINFLLGNNLQDNISVKKVETVNVYLHYKAIDSVPIPDFKDTSMKLAKSVEKVNGQDDVYDLTLSVSGSVANVEQKIPMDFLLIVDQSGSMGNNGRSMKDVGRAVDTLIEAIEGNGSIDAKYSVVGFASSAETKQTWKAAEAARTSWWEPQSQYSYDISKTIGDLSANGGTNYQAGIKQGKTNLASGRSNARKIVVFFTDGIPTYYLNTAGNIAGTGNSDSDNNCINAALGEIASMNCDEFYAIGFGMNLDSDKAETIGNAAGNLYHLCQVVPTPKTGRYIASDTSALQNAFGSIATSVTSILCDKVTLTDPLSNNVYALPSGIEGKPEITITVKRPSKEDIVGTEGKVDVPVSSQNPKTVDFEGQYSGSDNSHIGIWAEYTEQKEVKLHFPEKYKLEPGWTYEVSLRIAVTEDAYAAYRKQNNTYLETEIGETSTGTYAGETGLYSNNNSDAKVTYRYNNEDGETNFPKPVIQVNPGKLIIEKTIVGLTSEEETSLKENLKFKVDLEWNRAEDSANTEPIQETVYYSLNGERFKVDDNGEYVSYTDNLEENSIKLQAVSAKNELANTYTLTLDGLSPNTKCTVTEIVETAQVVGYTLTASDAPNPVIVARAGTGSVSFTNTYEPSQIRILVDKQLKNWIEPTKGGLGVNAVTFKLYKANISETETDNWQQGEVVNAEWGSISANENDLSHGISGNIEISDGHYLLVEETTAPGYQKLTQPIRIVVAGNQITECYIADESGNKTITCTLETETETWKIFVENDRIYTPVLPDTGGPGLAMIERCGWFLLMMALLMAGVEVRCYGEKKYRRAAVVQREENEEML